MLKINFTPFPEIRTSRLILRPLYEQDAEAVFRLRSDKEVARYLNRPLQEKVEEAETFIAKINSGISLNEWIMWVIADGETRAFMGSICLWQINKVTKTADVGYELLPEFQRKGYTKEALEAVINYGFTKLGLEFIEAEFTPDNIPSRNLLNQFHFKQVQNKREDQSVVVFRLGK